MTWLTDRIETITQILGSIFTALVIFMAIKEIYQKKMISVILLLILAGLLGWLVFDTKNAIDVLKGFWTSGGAVSTPKAPK